MTERPDFVQSVALVIGIDAYENGVPPLRTAAADATRLAQILEADYGYDIRLLTDRDASGAAISAALGDLGRTLGPDDRALFYFAGHGVALDGDDGPTGYLLPQDAVRGEAESYLHMPAVNEALTAVPARHLLVILDSCFSGAFRWSSTRDLVMVPEVVHQERYDRFILDPAWQAIASASHDQTALDALPGTFGDRGDVGGHSPFAAALFEALGGAADLVPAGEGNGVITASELYLYLEQAVQPATIDAGHRQTPRLWPLAKHDKGEFIFLVPGHELNLPPAPPLTYENNPWRGLASYDEADADLFFGRDAVVDGLRAHAGSHVLSAVLGASGTGKSSVVKAGLVPRLKAEGWQVLPAVRPGADPLHAFEVAVAGLDVASAPLHPEDVPLPTAEPIAAIPTTSPLPLGEGEGGASATEAETSASTALPIVLPAHGGDGASAPVRDDHRATADAIAARIGARIGAWLAAHPDGRLALVVDQLEELVTLTRTPAERDAALGLLRRLCEAHPDRLRLVLTLRSDFEPQFDRSALEGLWAAGRFVVPPFSQAELREVIEKPASERVMYFEPHALVDELVEEVIQTPGGLPLLSFALSEMYVHYIDRQSDDRAIERVDYEGVGGVVGALRTRADAEVEGLDGAGRETMRRVMLRMVAAEGSGIARRRVPREELVYPDPAETARVEEVVRRLTAARLVVEGRDDDGEPYVEPAHDALVRAWDRLLGWIHAEQDRVADLRFQHNMARAAGEWGRTEGAAQNGLLWRDAARGSVLDELVAQEDDALDPAGLPAVARLRRGARTLRRRVTRSDAAAEPRWMSRDELAFARRSIQRRTQIRLGLTVLVALIVLGGVTAVIQSRIAAAQRDTATARYFATLAEDALDRDPVEALVFARQAVTARDPVLPEAVLSLFAALQSPVVAAHLAAHDAPVLDVTFNEDGERMLTVGADGVAKVWAVEVDSAGVRFTSDRPLTTIGDPRDAVQVAALSPDGRRLAVAAKDVWETDQPVLWSLRSVEDSSDVVRLGGPMGAATTVQWSLDGQHVLFLDGWHGAVVWDADTGTRLGTFGKPSRAPNADLPVPYRITDALFGMGGHVVTRTRDGTAQVWSVRDSVLAFEVGTPAPAGGTQRGTLTVSGNGRRVALLNSGQPLGVWEIETGELVRQLGTRAQTGDIVLSAQTLALSRDGRIALVSYDDGGIQARAVDGSLYPMNTDLRLDPTDPTGFAVLNAIDRGRAGSRSALDPWGERAAALDADGRARVWNTRVAAPTDALVISVPSQITDVTFSPWGLLATGAADGTVRFWTAPTYGIVGRIEGPEGAYLRISEDGRYVLTSGESPAVWSTVTGEQVETMTDATPSYKLVEEGGRLAIRDRWTDAVVSTLEGVGGPADYHAFSARGDRLVLLTDGRRRTRVFEIATGQPVGLSVEHPFDLMSAHLTPGGGHVVAVGINNEHRLVDVATGGASDLNQALGPAFGTLEYGPGDSLVAHVPSPGQGLAVQVVDITTQRVVAGIPAQRASRAAFSPTGDRLLTVGEDCVVRVWTWRPEVEMTRSFSGHARDGEDGCGVQTSFSEDGQNVLSLKGEAGVAYLWSAGTDRAPIALGDPWRPLSAVAFGPQGSIVGIETSGTAVVFTQDVQSMLDMASHSLPFGFTDEHAQAILSRAQ